MRLFPALLLIFILLTIAGCKVKDRLTGAADTPDATRIEMWESVRSENIDFNWYWAKADVQITMDGFSMGGKADIRVRKDSVIWMSVRKFGLEMARVLIRPDSVFALNRLQANYISMSIDSVNSIYQLPFDFAQWQEIVAGNHPTSQMVPYEGKTFPDGYKLLVRGEQITSTYLLDRGRHVSEARYEDQKEGHSVEVIYSDRTEYGNLTLPETREYFYPAKAEPLYTLRFRLERIEIDQPKSIRFEIPKAYSKL